MAAGGVVAGMDGGNLKRTVLGHLSRDCNSPELAAAAVRKSVEGAGAAADSVEVFVAEQKTISPRFSVSF